MNNNSTEKLPHDFHQFRLLIDADIVAMRFACKHETPHRFPDNDQTLPEDPEAFTVRDEETAKKEAKEFIENLMYRVGTEDVLLCFTGKNNWRKRVFPSYKHNRAGKWVPELRTTLTEYLMEKFHHLRVAELEADVGPHCVLGLDGKGWRLTVEPRPDGEAARSLHIFRARKALAQYVGQGFI